MFIKRLLAKALSIVFLQRLTRCFLRINNLIKSEGSALVTVMILVIVVAMIAVVGTRLIQTSYSIVRHQEHQGAEVDNVARAGLVDAISWFKAQPSQPVCSPQGGPWPDAAFNPQYSTSAVLCATIDTSIGLVQEYPINPALGIYGRYEVCRQTNPIGGVVIDSYAVHDITGQRYFNGSTTGQGYAWYIGSKGYIYKASSPWFTCNGATSTFKMHNVIARSLVSTEIRRLTLNNPPSPVLIINKPVAKDATVDQRGVISGQNGQASYGLMYTNDGVNPLYLVNGGSITQPTSTYAVPPASGTVSYVLGVSTSDLKLMANYVVTDVSQLPCPLPSLCLTYITPASGTAEFGASNQLFSCGILFVDGNLTLDSDAYCCYQGLIYCTGTVTINDSNIINGCVICSGLYLGKSGAAESSQITFSKSFLSTVRTVVCQYREMKSTYRVFTGIQGF